MGSLEDQLKLAFQVFDHDSSQKISKDEALACLKAINAYLKSDATEQDFDFFFKESDVNSDGDIDPEEFIASMISHPKFQDFAPF